MRVPNPEDRALVALLPRRICVEIDVWRRAYDPNYALFPPHITVAYPPFVPEVQWPVVRTAMRQCLARFDPFPIRLGGLGAFEGDHHVLWLRVDDGGVLSRIRTSLMECLPTYVPALPFAYVPHVTIGAFQSYADLKLAEATLSSQLRPRRFTLHRLTYLFPGALGVWSVSRHVPLGIGGGLTG